MKIFALLLASALWLFCAAQAATVSDFTQQLELAKGGDRNAQSAVAQVYARGGLGVPRNTAEAIIWWERAAEQGDVVSQNQLAALYLFSSPDKARRWNQLAADQGDARAAQSLGFYYEGGLQGRQDLAESFKWYRRAAELGSVESMHIVSTLYATGRGVTADSAEALRWERKAAEGGYSPAQFAMGEAYALGKGVPVDREQAFAFYQKAAGQGSARAIAKISEALYTGKGMKQDYVEFLAWITVKPVPQDLEETKSQGLANFDRLKNRKLRFDENTRRRRKAEKTVGADGVRDALKRAEEIEAGIATSPPGELARIFSEASKPLSAQAAISPKAVSVASSGIAATPQTNSQTGDFGSRFKELFKSKELQTVPVPIKQKAPFYPFHLRRENTAGFVVVEFIIDTAGDVVEARVVESSLVDFEEPALKAVREWKFKPGRINSRAVNVLATQRLEFGIGP